MQIIILSNKLLLLFAVYYSITVYLNICSQQICEMLKVS